LGKGALEQERRLLLRPTATPPFPTWVEALRTPPARATRATRTTVARWVISHTHVPRIYTDRINGCLKDAIWRGDICSEKQGGWALKCALSEEKKAEKNSH